MALNSNVAIIIYIVVQIEVDTIMNRAFLKIGVMMSYFFRSSDHIMLLADYTDPKPHCHLASHLIISLQGESDWTIDGEHVKSRALYIGANALHTGTTPPGGNLVFFFKEVSCYAGSFNEKFPTGKSYTVLDECTTEKVLCAYRELHDIQKLDMEILRICGIYGTDKPPYDERIRVALSQIENTITITNDMVNLLSQNVFLSKSRFSHLFREQTRMTLHSYLAFEKLHKTYIYMQSGRSITESCLLAGFDSSSHCAATCKRMFGMSLSDFHKSLATN